MSKQLLISTFAICCFIFCGCRTNRITPAPGAPETNAENYAEKYWKDIARPIPVFKTAAKTEKMFEQYTGLFHKHAPYLLEEYKAADKVLGWPQGTYLKRMFYPLDHKAMAKQPGHECTSWAVLPDLAAENQVFLHKSRDTKIRKSAIIHHRSPGKFGYIGLCDVGLLDVAMGMNSVGVAITVNSGDKSDGENQVGFDTTVIARIILENSQNAREAIHLLKKLITSQAYAHGERGSIWLIADKDNVFVAENDGLRFAAQKHRTGFVIRANTWSLPQMLPFSQNPAGSVFHSRSREFAVTRSIFGNGKEYKRPVTAEHIAAAARVSRIPKYPKAGVPCASWTVSAATFSIDREFPADLSTMYASVGNPDHTIFIPVPGTVDQLPESLLTRTFYSKINKALTAKKKILTDETRAAVEKEINKNHRTAREQAREILRKSFSTANRLKARKLLNDTFKKNWQIISRHIK